MSTNSRTDSNMIVNRASCRCLGRNKLWNSSPDVRIRGERVFAYVYLSQFYLWINISVYVCIRVRKCASSYARRLVQSLGIKRSDGGKCCACLRLRTCALAASYRRAKSSIHIEESQYLRSPINFCYRSLSNAIHNHALPPFISKLVHFFLFRSSRICLVLPLIGHDMERHRELLTTFVTRGRL